MERSRYQIWEENYIKVTREGLQRSLNTLNLTNHPDEVSVHFENVKDKLVELENQVAEYSSTHKTHLYFCIQESKNELYIQLDKLRQEDFRVERRELYLRLDRLSSQLDRKVHSESVDDCSHCFKHIVVVPQLNRK